MKKAIQTAFQGEYFCRTNYFFPKMAFNTIFPIFLSNPASDVVHPHYQYISYQYDDVITIPFLTFALKST